VTASPAALKAAEKLFRQESRFIAGADSWERMPPSGAPEVAFAGRSNVGKSSLINALTGRKALARSSSTPGRTQQINFFELGAGALCLVDLPGYGYAVASKVKIAAWNDLIDAYLSGRRMLRRVCILVDARHGLKDSDREMMEMLDKGGVSFTIVLTKCDKAKDRAALTASILKELKPHPCAYPEVFETSTADGTGIPELRAFLAEV
jgi:GTP-binding protein